LLMPALQALENKEPGCPDGQTLTKRSEMRLHRTISAVVASIVLPVGVSNAQVKQKISEERRSPALANKTHVSKR